MKFLKKTAALLFCVALALSVMAVSAMAADPVFTVTLEQATTDTHTNINGNDYVEYNQGDTAVYNIVLKADAQQVTALDFKLDTPTGLALTGVTSAFVTGGTVSANTNSVYSLTLSTTGDGNTVVPLTTNNTTGTVVATATYTVGSAVANNATLEFKVTDIVVHVKDVVAETTDTAPATKTIEVDPEYTITVYNPATNGTTGVIDAPDDKSGAADTTSVAFTYSMFDGVSQNITTPTPIDGYTFNATFHVEDPASSTTGNWNDNESVAQSYTIAAVAAANTPSTERKWGNVDIVADYTATVYTVTYNLANNPVATAEITGRAPESSVSDNTMTYTIESVVASTDKTNFGKATRAGYTFKGWTIGAPEAKNSAGTTTSDIVANSFWTTFDASTNKFQSQATDDTVQKAFGNVTLTANWEIVGKRAEVDYKYANSTDVLILFAVPDTVDSQPRAKGTYRCGGEGEVNKMFVLSDSTANSAQDEVASALLNAYVALFNAEDGVQNTGWTIYGYIAAPNAPITFTSGNSDGNGSILYNGDVNQNSVVNAGDYGIAYDLVSGWANYTYEALTVENRLRAHIDAAAKLTGENNAVSMVGTIADINAIMLLAGNSIS